MPAIDVSPKYSYLTFGVHFKWTVPGISLS